jgi:IgGFc binding protein
MRQLLVVILLFISYLAHSEESQNELNKKKPEGTDFWLCFMRNHNDPLQVSEQTKLLLQLFITSDKTATVTVEIPALGYKETKTITGGTVEDFVIDSRAQIKSSEVIEVGMGVHVTSDVPIIVYGLNRRRQTTDSFMGLPSNVLGTVYRAMCYDGSDLFPEMAVVATEDNTRVTITPTVETNNGKEANLPFSIVLNKGDVYQVAARPQPFSRRKWDLTGSLISADKKIAVFSGHQCAYVPTKDVIACNHLVEQMPPVGSWGKHYYLGNLHRRTKYSFRVLANQDSTKVFINAKVVKILGAGEYYEANADTPLQVSGSNPVLVTQYSQGFSNGDKIGDPMMMLISPTQQFLTKYRFTTPVKGFWDHYVNIVVPTGSISSLRIDGKRIDSSRFSKLGESRYSLSYVKLEYGTHELSCDEPFGMSIYGFGYDKDQYDAYGTIGGQSFIEYENVKDSLAPDVTISQPKSSIFQLAIRDDRPFDSGIKQIRIINSVGMIFQVPPFDRGLPQLIINTKISNSNTPSIANIEVEDEAGNKKEFTLCYSYDSFAGKYVLNYLNGRQLQCENEPEFTYGAYLIRNYNSHSADFSRTGNLTGRGVSQAEIAESESRWGKFNDAFATSGLFGVMVAKRFAPTTVLSARLSIEGIGGVLTAPDRVIQNYRNPITNQIETFQEGRTLEINGQFMNLNVTCEYYLTKNFYLTAALETGLLMTKSVEYKTQILYPVDYLYGNGSREFTNTSHSLSSLNSMRFGGSFGFGFIYPITTRFAPFFELNERFWLNSVISDGNWHIRQTNILLGLRFTM